jgi:hypothetical protein
MTLVVSALNIDVSEATTAPLGVINWEATDGVLLAVCFKYGDTSVFDGTAVMIGLGLALSAKHNFDDHRDALLKGDAVLMCFGMRPGGGLVIWQCTGMNAHDAGDLELLSLKLISDLPADGHFKVASLTTRIPPPGETVTIMGFRFKESIPWQSINETTTVGGGMYASQGSAGEFSYPIHDSVLAPYPTIEVFSGSLGGMSGGAVLDVIGHVIGVTSWGLESDDQQGPTLAAWWMSAYCWRLSQQSWPPGHYPEGAAIYEIPTINIVGREHVRVLDEPNFALTRWT